MTLETVIEEADVGDFTAEGKKLAAMLRLLADACEASESADDHCAIGVDFPLCGDGVAEAGLHHARVRIEFVGVLDVAKVNRIVKDPTL